jgi:ATP-binding cassette subfamily B protein
VTTVEGSKADLRSVQVEGSEKWPGWKTWAYTWRVALFRPGLYFGMTGIELYIFALAPLIVGALTRLFFDTLTGTSIWRPLSAEMGVWGILALMAANDAFKAGIFMLDFYWFFAFQDGMAALLRRNLFHRILQRPGARAVPGSPGEAISRFRGDVEAIGHFMEGVIFLLEFGVQAIVAAIVMYSIEPRVTLIVVLPLASLIVVANVATKGIQKYHQAGRKAAGAVTGFIGEMFGAVQAVKVASAEQRVVERFRALNDVRRQADLKATLFGQTIHAVMHNVAQIGTGVVLLLVGRLMQPGPDGTAAFSVGDLALFVQYLGLLTGSTGMFGMIAAQYREAGVSYGRMTALLQGAPSETLVQHNPVYLRGEFPKVPYTAKRDEHRLERLEVSGLTCLYPGTDKGVRDVNLRLEQGTFTVITGRIGSGKTTLLRALLGLLPADAGEICWNGKPVIEPASFFVPPRCAYTAQVPLLFSETLRDNILLGLPADRVDLEAALRLAVLEENVAGFEEGLETMLGAKGVKLSGGQRQRTAAARMYVRQPELLVFDDLSSALDVETERTLWERLFDTGGAAHRAPTGDDGRGGDLPAPAGANNRAPTYVPTCLVVSHRRPALRRADRIVVLKEGRVEAEGRLEELLERCEEMRRLWEGKVADA